ncbi:DEAD/DEAH box helicase family protein [uncultured Thiodictyon sp.]|uniref:DEAD/DEAH box helicase family protein n=1 Tax=uncultured Thiodictyon sp. TaxID=1846217 RepID=UPI0025F6E539|nr:DEAD/DEAH box helicase family protein [uncultured Thiodictyon sp.]
MARHRPWTLESARALLDLSGGDPALKALGEQQLTTAVALHRLLLDHRIAYLADEVGTGKTYVALAVAALFRHLDPGFRVLYLAPSRNVREKWVKREVPAFLERNVREADLRVRTVSKRSPVPLFDCDTLDQWLAACTRPAWGGDTFLNFTAFSFRLDGGPERWRERLRELGRNTPRPPELRGNLPDNREGKDSAKRRAARHLYRHLPTYDLLVIDEAHLLKAGIGTSDRVNFLARVLGTHRDCREWGGERRIRRALLLSATPFDRDLGQLVKQLEIVDQADAAMTNRVRALRPAAGSAPDWERIQEGLRSLMIRGDQFIEVRDQTLAERELSRNQYRVEHRSGPQAEIRLRDRTDPEALRQRLFTALVQKKLTDCLGARGGGFPLAMFASWEAYSLPAPNPANAADADDAAGDAPPDGVIDPLDLGGERAGGDAGAIDGDILRNLVTAHIRLFNSEEPPHPKLEAEALRLGTAAFEEGRKQLVFVRRIKSVDDLKRRLEARYDRYLADYLHGCGLGTAQEWLDTLAAARGEQRPAPGPQDADAIPGARAERETNQPSTAENLFAWFFRGKIDKPAAELAEHLGLPDPYTLRQNLIDPGREESLIGELDWVAWVKERVPGFDIVPRDVAQRMGRLDRGTDRLDRYRRAQTAWLLVASERAPGATGIAARRIADYQQAAFGIRAGQTPGIAADTVTELLAIPTLPAALVAQDLGEELLPTWGQTWSRLIETNAADANVELALRRLDLHREILFSLLRLDHPFVDLYVAHCRAIAIGHGLVDSLIELLAAGDPERFGTRRILGQLALGLEQVLKTNFADLLSPSRGVERDQWRREIAARLLPFAPVAWASGGNASSRSAIARRFRMPGYPFVLVSTSVLQEGEDLHVFCADVTHYGISGSPVGIEQKNGRVDRVGALARRRLEAADQLREEDKIQVRFPHLPESLEWFQIRELCARLNQYQESMHRFVREPESAKNLNATLADRSPIPPQLTQRLRSPFEPELDDRPHTVTVEEVRRTISAARIVQAHAHDMVERLGPRFGLAPVPGEPDRFRSADGAVRLEVMPAAGLGELMISGVATLPPDGGPNPRTADPLTAAGADCRYRIALRFGDAGQAIYDRRADCLAKGDGVLDEGEVLDLAARLGLPGGVEAEPAKPKVLLEVLRRCRDGFKKIDVRWKPGRGANLPQWLWLGSGLRRRIDLRVVDAWLEMSVPVAGEANPQWLLMNNDNPLGLAYYLDRRHNVRARMVQPLRYLHAEELLSMVRSMDAASRTS